MGGLTCGENTCETGDYCGYDQAVHWDSWFTGHKHVCIKMYSRETNETFGSPTHLKLREVEGVLPSRSFM